MHVSRMQRKMQFFEQLVMVYMFYRMVLYIQLTLDQYGVDLSKLGPLLCSILHRAVYYTDLFIGKKKLQQV